MYVEVIARSAPQGQARQSAQQLPQIYIRQDIERHSTFQAELPQISLFGCFLGVTLAKSEVLKKNYRSFTNNRVMN